MARRAALALALCVGCTAPAAAQEDFRVLVFSKTAGFRHGSIGAGTALVQGLGATNNFGVDTTEDASQFNDANLAGYAVVIWLNTTGDVLDGAQQGAFERFVQSGGGYVGTHSATDTEYGWPWYGQLIGGDAWFSSHPAIQNASLSVEDGTHDSTQHYPSTFSFTDEWYNFQNNPRPAVNVLVTIDESSYSPGANAMGADHPISWYHAFDGGRSWYTAMGHRDETFQDSDFGQHLLGGILWAAGSAQAACTGLSPAECDDGDPCTGDSCDDGSGECVNSAEPLAGCFMADAARIRLIDRPNKSKHKLSWKWVRRDAVATSALGDPTATTGYSLCVYDSSAGVSSVATALAVPAGDAWSAKKEGTFKYTDKTRGFEGVQNVLLRAGGLHDARVKLTGVGVNLPLPPPVTPERYFDHDPTVTLQLVSDAGACWASQFTTFKRNDAERFDARLP